MKNLPLKISNVLDFFFFLRRRGEFENNHGSRIIRFRIMCRIQNSLIVIRGMLACQITLIKGGNINAVREIYDRVLFFSFFLFV